MKTKNKKSHQSSVFSLTDNQLPTSGLCTVAALDSGAFSKLNVNEAIPATWEERAKKAWEYYVEEPIVANVIDAWKAFAVGDEIKITCDDEDVKWEAIELADKLNLHKLLSDILIQTIVKGSGYAYKRYNKAGNDIEQLLCLNPLSIKAKYIQGELTEAKQYSEDRIGAGNGITLPVEQLLHLKWRAPIFASQGNSMILPAFQSIELLRDYRRAQAAIAKRWTTPLRLVKVGGQFGQKLIMPDQKMLETIRGVFNKMDLRSGVVVPFFVDVSTHGAEGEVLSTQKDIQDVKEDIMVAMGMNRAIVSAEGPNFATASIAFRKVLIVIRELKQYAKAVLRWIFDDWQEINGYQEKSIQFIFPELDLNNELDVKKLLLELFDRGLISKNSLQLKMDLNPEVELAKRDNERKKPLDIPDAKTIVDMVNAGIISIETAQEMLGLDKAKEQANIAKAEIEDVNRIYQQAMGRSR
ncbi:MAG: hypothetical protein HZA78_08940 [Candidatus Schekmanbacteria bacterium]|nr:hypothetical protein [Candidatus Schekmanbacteria bacterium]